MVFLSFTLWIDKTQLVANINSNIVIGANKNTVLNIFDTKT